MGAVLAMTIHRKASMRGLALAFCCTLSSCSALQQSLPSALGFSGKDSAPDSRFVAASQSGAAEQVFSVQQLNAAANFVQISRSDRGVRTWITGNGLSVSTKNGMIVGTRGFGGDLLAADASESAAIVRARKSGYAKRFMTQLNGDDQADIQAFQCQISNQGNWPLDLNGKIISTTLMQEDCKGGGRAFRNLYWVGGTGAHTGVLQSRQWINETLGALISQRANR